MKAEDIIMPDELAAKLKVPDSWVYEKTGGRCRNPIPCLRLGRYVRFNRNFHYRFTIRPVTYTLPPLNANVGAVLLRKFRSRGDAGFERHLVAQGLQAPDVVAC